nr:biotin/lipoyl-containing protein [Micromonospora sp. DSM 115978]
HNRWIETEFDNTIPAFTGGADAEDAAGQRETVVVEVGGKRLEVVLPASFAVAAPAGGAAGGRGKAPKRKGGAKAGAAATGDALTSPMQGTIVKVAVSDGDVVKAGDLVVVLEAMKMEQPINAHRDGTVSGLSAAVGAVVTSNAVL